MVENPQGLELLVVSGELHIDGEPCTALSWARLPAGRALSASVCPAGAQVWIKEGQLRHPEILPMPT